MSPELIIALRKRGLPPTATPRRATTPDNPYAVARIAPSCRAFTSAALAALAARAAASPTPRLTLWQRLRRRVLALRLPYHADDQTPTR